MPTSAKISRIVATVAYAAFIIFEIYHDLIARIVWPGYSLNANYVVFVLVPLWAAAAVCLWLRRRPTTLFWAIAGILTTLSHGVMTRTGESDIGFVFIAAVIPLIPLTRSAWRAEPPATIHASRAWREREPERRAA